MKTNSRSKGGRPEGGRRGSSELRDALRDFGWPHFRSHDEDFRETIKFLIDLIRDFGIEKCPPPYDSAEKVSAFFAAVHEGWKGAHNIIVDHISARLKVLPGLENERVRCFREKDSLGKQTTIKKIEILKNEIIILRRMYDGIAWSMLKQEWSHVRRMSIEGGGNSLSLENIKDAAPLINSINADPGIVAISCDVTTFMHIGDVLKCDPGRAIEFIEIKSGEKNRLITEMAYLAIKNPNSGMDEVVGSRFDENDKKHFERAKKQAVRANRLVEVMRSGRGVDPRTGRDTSIFETSCRPCTYSEELTSGWKGMGERDWVILTIDGCLMLGIYRDLRIAALGFVGWMKAIGFDGIIVGIGESFINGDAMPFVLLDLPVDMLKEIVDGKLFVVVGIDLGKFVDLAQSLYPNRFSLASEIGSKSGVKDQFHSLTVSGKRILCHASDGDVILCQGLSDRMLFQLQTPRSVIDILGERAEVGFFREGSP